MARIPLVTRDASPAEQAAYDAFSARRGSEPRSVLIRSSRICRRWRNVWKRSAPTSAKGRLSPKLQEIAMLTVAREMNCAFIWYAHAAAARQAGVRGEMVDSTREKRALTGLAPEEQVVVGRAGALAENPQG